MTSLKQHREISQRLTEATLKLMEAEAELARDPQNRKRLGELANLYDKVGRFPQAAQFRRRLEGLPSSKTTR